MSDFEIEGSDEEDDQFGYSNNMSRGKASGGRSGSYSASNIKSSIGKKGLGFDDNDDGDVYDFEYEIENNKNRSKSNKGRIAAFSPAGGKGGYSYNPKQTSFSDDSYHLGGGNKGGNHLRLSTVSNESSALDRAKSIMDRYSNKSFDAPKSNFKGGKARHFDEDDISIDDDDDEDFDQQESGDIDISESHADLPSKLPVSKPPVVSSVVNPPNLDTIAQNAKHREEKVKFAAQLAEESAVYSEYNDSVPEESIRELDESAIPTENDEENEMIDEYSNEEFDEVDEANEISPPPRNSVDTLKREDKVKPVAEEDEDGQYSEDDDQEEGEDDNGSYSRIVYDPIDPQEDSVSEESVDEVLKSSKSKILSFADLAEHAGWDPNEEYKSDTFEDPKRDSESGDSSGGLSIEETKKTIAETAISAHTTATIQHLPLDIATKPSYLKAPSPVEPPFEAPRAKEKPTVGIAEKVIIPSSDSQKNVVGSTPSSTSNTTSLPPRSAPPSNEAVTQRIKAPLPEILPPKTIVSANPITKSNEVVQKSIADGINSQSIAKEPNNDPQAHTQVYPQQPFPGYPQQGPPVPPQYSQFPIANPNPYLPQYPYPQASLQPPQQSISSGSPLPPSPYYPSPGPVTAYPPPPYYYPPHYPTAPFQYPYPYYPGYYPPPPPSVPSYPPYESIHTLPTSSYYSPTVREVQQQKPVILELVQELNAAQAEANWAKEKLAETIVFLRKSGISTTSLPGNSSSFQSSESRTTSQFRSSKASARSEQEDEGEDKATSDGEYSEDFETSQLNVSASSPKKPPRASTSVSWKSLPKLSEEPELPGIDDKKEIEEQIMNILKRQSQSSYRVPPELSTSDPITESVAKSFLASQELLRTKLESLRMRLKVTASQSRYAEDLQSASPISPAPDLLQPTLASLKADFEVQRKRNQERMIEFIRQKYPDVHEDELTTFLNMVEH